MEDMGVSNKKHKEEVLDEAEKLVGLGRNEEAKRLLWRLLEGATELNLYQDVQNIFLSGSLYKEAIMVYERYKELTGKNMASDYSIEEIKNKYKE